MEIWSAQDLTWGLLLIVLTITIHAMGVVTMALVGVRIRVGLEPILPRSGCSTFQSILLFKGGACQELWKPAPRLLEARECV
jgi:hypothetical protein